jgi:hypothetical protein
MRNNNDDIKDVLDIINNTEKMKPTQPIKTYDDYMIEEFENYFYRLDNQSDREHLMALVRDFCAKPIF